MSELATDKFGQTIYEIDGAVLEKFHAVDGAGADNLRPGRFGQVKGLQSETLGDRQRADSRAPMAFGARGWPCCGRLIPN